MSQVRVSRFAHTDVELMRARMKLTPGERIQAMLDAYELQVGLMRGRLCQKYPHLSEREINLKILEEIDRAKRARPNPFSGYSAKA
jgi:hypothetical protein